MKVGVASEEAAGAEREGVAVVPERMVDMAFVWYLVEMGILGVYIM